jgi:23S rRNA (guanine745-N1)-methyltransferase
MDIIACRNGYGIGIDISKEALRVAGVRPSVKSGELTLFAAGVYHMPIRDHSVDMVLNFFAPLATEEYGRVLKENGVLIMAIPAARHLWEMKEVLYDTPKENQVEDFALPGFTLLEEREVTSSFILEGQEKIHALFSMTPYYFRTPKEGRARLAALDTLAVTGRFHLLVYRKAGQTLDR